MLNGEKSSQAYTRLLVHEKGLQNSCLYQITPHPLQESNGLPLIAECPFKLSTNTYIFKVSAPSKSGILTNKMNIFFCLNVLIFLTMRDCAIIIRRRKAVKPERASYKLTPKGRGATCHAVFNQNCHQIETRPIHLTNIFNTQQHITLKVTCFLQDTCRELYIKKVRGKRSKCKFSN